MAERDSERISGASVLVETETAPRGGAGSENDVAVVELFHWIYRFFYSKTIGLILILLMAFFAVVGSVIMQAGPGVYDDPAQLESFLAAAKENFGGWVPILNALGFFHVFSSVGFYVVVAMLGLSITACTTHRIPELWQRVHRPRVHVVPKFFDKARYRGSAPTTLGREESLEVVRGVLKRHRFRVLVDDKDPEHSFYADRYSWSGVGTVIAHISFIIILLAFVISSTWGIEEDIAAPIGREVEVGHGTGLTLVATSFKDSYTEEGRPSDYVSQLELRRGDAVVATQEVRVNNPLEYEGFRYHQSSFGIAADVTVRDASGQAVFEGSIPMRWKSQEGANAVGLFELPELKYEVVVVTAASGRTDSSVPAGAALFELYPLGTETGEPIDTRLATQGQPVQLAEYSFTFDRERQYTGIRMRNDPGTPWMWVGSTLLVVGMCITFMFPYRRMWIRVDDAAGEEAGRVRCGSVARLDTSYQRLFENIVAEIDDDLYFAAVPTEEENHG
ncbi:MAG: cytochrome c biogenesis protein ResB [Ancrocorticia sp.]